MENHRTTVNEGVNVTAWYFANKRQLTTFPRRIEFRGTTYTFLEGLQYLIKNGQQLVRIFDMTDGKANYRLKCDEERANWTLVNITECA